MKQPLFVFLKFFGFLLVFTGISGCGGSDLEEAKELRLEQESIPVEKGHGITVTYTDSAKLKARVKANTIQRFEKDGNSRLEMPDGVIAYFFNDRGERSSTLTSKYGVRYPNKGRTIVKDSVVVVNKEGDTLRTERMVWNERKDFIRSQSDVTVKTPEEIIYAKGFRSNPSFTEYEFYKIKGTVTLDQ
jgi:LPS export ABC transporter protein LptC